MNRKQRRKLLNAVAATIPNVEEVQVFSDRHLIGAIISAAAPQITDGAIIATWDADFTIVAEAPKPDPNPAANTDGKSVKPPTPRFNISAYNGGPMKLNGYRFPVIVDGTGIKAAGANIPVYAGHSQPWADPSDQAEQLMGQTDSFNVEQSTGKLNVAGMVTAEPGKSETVDKLVGHAKNGFKFQASINAQPSKLDFLPENVSAQVNGRTVTGPVVIARAVTCDHVAIVPLGADTSTETNIAAEAAKGQTMEFAAWLTATYDLDASKITASQKAKFEAEFARISASGGAAGNGNGATAGNGNGATATVTNAAVGGATTATATLPLTLTAEQSAGLFVAAQNKAAADNLDRMAKIAASAKDHPTIAAQAVRENWTVDKTELEVLRAERTAQQSGNGHSPISAGPAMPKDGLQMVLTPASRGGRGRTANGGRISDGHAAIIEAAGLISAGYSAERLVKNPAYGQRVVEMADGAMEKFGHGLGPMGLMRLAANFAGVSLPHNNDDAYKVIVAEFSTLALPTILSNLMNKFLLDSYNAVDPDWAEDPKNGTTAWMKFCKKGPVQDFKPHFRLRLTGNLEFKDLGPSGEIQSGKVSEQSYSIQAATKAIMFGITRQNIIDDDLSAMSTLPTMFGRGAGIRIAKFIYGLLIAALQSDRTTAFFSSSAITTVGNLMQPNLFTGAGLSFTTLEAAEAGFMAQTDPDGLPAGIMAELLLVPPALLNLARQLWQSMDLIPSLSVSGNNRGVPVKNTLSGRFRPVCSQWLASLTAAQINDVIKGLATPTSNAGSNSTWYLSAGPQQAAYPLEVGFLNGQEMPIVERDEMQFDRLGIAFRGFIDFGANLAEPRSIVKNTA